RSSRIAQCGRPPPCSWSAITSSLQARMMRMRVSQSLQLVATLSFSTELRWRVFRRCCKANIRARPRVIGSWNQRQRATKRSTAWSMRATTPIGLTEERDEGDDEHDQRSRGEEGEGGLRDVGQVRVARDRRGVMAVVVIVVRGVFP